MTSLREILGSNIRHFRERTGLSQKELAKRAGFESHQIISQIEIGNRDVKVWELFKLAEALFIDISRLTSKVANTKLSTVYWRRVPSNNRKVYEADFENKCNQFALVERLCGLDSSDKLYKLNVEIKELASMNLRSAQELGVKVRDEMALGPCPATCLIRILEEKYNVKIWYMDLGYDGSAASLKGDFGASILINSNEKPWRRNYSCAHELFHLLTWDYIDDTMIESDNTLAVKLERLAEAFSSALLIPEETLKVALSQFTDNGGIQEIKLIEIARMLNVSTDALLWRMCNLGITDEESVRVLLGDVDFKNIDRLSRKEIEDDALNIPERFVRLAFQAFQIGNLSRTKMAEFFGVGLLDLSDFLAEYDLDDSKSYTATINTSRY